MNQSKHFNNVIKQNAIYVPPLIPKEYQQVEYIQADGSQYINTGVQPSQPYIKCKFKANRTDGSCIWGTNVSSAWNYCSMSFYRDTLYVGTNREYNLGTGYGTSVHYVEYNTPDCEIIIDDVVKLTDITTISITSPIRIGDRGDTSMRLKGCIYEFSVYDKSVSLKVFDGIPCYRKSDNKPGMYDCVTNTFLTSAGTRDFTVGSDV